MVAPKTQQRQQKKKQSVRVSSSDEEASKRNTDCIYFLASPLTCKKGAKCEYRHSEYSRLNPRDCYYWLNGNCLHPKCGFRHPPLDGILRNQGGASAGVTKQPGSCSFFQKGKCVKGDMCSFMHTPNSVSNKKQHPQEAKPASDPQFPKRPIGNNTKEKKSRNANLSKAVKVEKPAAPRVTSTGVRDTRGVDEYVPKPVGYHHFDPYDQRVEDLYHWDHHQVSTERDHYGAEALFQNVEELFAEEMSRFAEEVAHIAEEEPCVAEDEARFERRGRGRRELSQGRLRDRRRETQEERRSSFSAPKGKRETYLGKRKSSDEEEEDDHRRRKRSVDTFAGPLPFSEILKRKRAAAAGGNRNDKDETPQEKKEGGDETKLKTEVVSETKPNDKAESEEEEEEVIWEEEEEEEGYEGDGEYTEEEEAIEDIEMLC